MAKPGDRNSSGAGPEMGLAEALRLHALGGDHAMRGTERLFRSLWPDYCRRFSRWGLPVAVAQEVASDALLKVLTGLAGLQDPVAFVKWSNTVARNTFLDHVRSAKAATQSEVFADAEGWDSIWAAVEDLEQLDLADRLCLQRQLEAFSRAHPERSMLLEQMTLEDWGVEEAAAAIGRSGAATKQYLSQCRKRLMGYLQLCFEGEGV